MAKATKKTKDNEELEENNVDNINEILDEKEKEINDLKNEYNTIIGGYTTKIDDLSNTINALKGNIELLNNRIKAIENENEKLKENLDKELDWQEFSGDTLLSQIEYEHLSEQSLQLKWNEAKNIIHKEFGFDENKITINESVITKYEINKYGTKRIKEQYSRPVLYKNPSQNYIRFTCCNHLYEMINGELKLLN